MVKLNKAQRQEASDVIEAVSSGNVELETYAFELVWLRARVAELETDRRDMLADNARLNEARFNAQQRVAELESEREAHAIATSASDEPIIARLRARAVAKELERDARTALAETEREIIRWLWRRCKIVCWPQRWDPPAYPLEHNESARKDSRNAIEHEMRQELAALRGENAP